MKAKKIDQNVLEVLSGLTVRGNFVTMSAQLDRKMYLKVNEVLAQLGGRWERSLGAHVFEQSPQEGLDNVIDTGEVVRDKDLGFFPTPPALAAELVDMAGVEPGMTALEPSAGEGAIVQALLDAGADVHAIELDPHRFEKLSKTYKARSDVFLTCGNFMDVFPGTEAWLQTFARVVMNPPFCKVKDCDHIHHVQRAFSWLRPGGVLVSVLPASVSFRQDRRYRAFRDWYKWHKGVLRDLPDDSFKASGTSVKTVVLKMEAKK
jgi:phospholipid N-methyltransferase